MNAEAHDRIMVAAFAALSAVRQAELDDLRPLLTVVGNYPDRFDNPTRTDAERDRDDPDWRRFTRFPPEIGGTTQHYWPSAIFDQARCRPMLAYLLGQAVAAFAAGDRAGGLTFVGCLSHYLGDVCQPIHTVDETLIEELLPRPPGLSGFHYHVDVEAVTGTCGPLQPPRLLGTTVEEGAWRLANANLAAIAACRPFVVPTIQALFAGDATAAERLAGPPLTRAAQGTADILHTALVLADGRVEAGEDATLATVDLRAWRPDAARHSSAYGGAIVDGGRATPPAGAPIRPATLRVADEARPVRGLGVMPTLDGDGPHACWMRFGLPAGEFDRFEALVGLDAGLTEGGAVDFVVSLDGREAFRSGRRTGADPALPVAVPLGTAAELTLRVEDANGGRTYFDNHAVWAEPRLVKGGR